MLNLLMNTIVKLAVRNFHGHIIWAKSTFCGVEAESMFIKFDLVLPRGLSSLYCINTKEERPFG